MVARLWRNPSVRLGLGIVAALVVFGVALRQAQTYASGGDLQYFLDRSRDVLAGRDPYAAIVAHPHDPSTGDYADIYMYSPFVYVLLSPLTVVGFKVAWICWATLNALFLLAGSVCLVRAIRPSYPLVVGLVAAAAVSLTSMARFELFYGNVDVALYFFLAAAFLAVRRDRPYLAGVFLGLGTAFYLQSLPFVLLYIWKREYRAALVGLGLFLVTFAGGLLVVGASAASHFAQMAALFFGNWSGFYINQSLYGVAVRLFQPTAYSGHPLVSIPWLPVMEWLLVALLTAVVVGRAVPRLPFAAEEDNQAGAEFALAVSLLLINFPVLEANTSIVAGLTLVAVALIVGDAQARRGRLPLRGGVAAVYVLTLVPLTSLAYSRLGQQRGLSGGRLIVSVLESVPYLYIAILLCALAFAVARWREFGSSSTSERVPVRS
jgi:hypothetical protein